MTDDLDNPEEARRVSKKHPVSLGAPLSRPSSAHPEKDTSTGTYLSALDSQFEALSWKAIRAMVLAGRSVALHFSSDLGSGNVRASMVMVAKCRALNEDTAVSVSPLSRYRPYHHLPLGCHLVLAAIPASSLPSYF